MGSLVQIRCILGSTIVRAGEGWLRLSGSFGGSSIRSRLELGKPMLLGGEGWAYDGLEVPGIFGISVEKRIRITPFECIEFVYIGKMRTWPFTRMRLYE